MTEMNDEAKRMLKECSTPTMTWWVIQFEDASYYGEVQDDGFALNLYSTKNKAIRDADRVMDGVDVYYRAVQITLPPPERE